MVEPSEVVLPSATTISTWQELAARAEHYSHDRWIFRGVTRKEHLLIPSIGREQARHEGFSSRTRSFDRAGERSILETFNRQARPYMSYSPQSDIEWLAIAQHHGMVTRLLDWTESLYVATYFATESGDIRETAAIYCMKEFMPYKNRNLEFEEDIFMVKNPYCYRPPHISPRIPAQRAIFTVHAMPEHALKSDSLEILHIPGKQCLEFKRLLDAAGFNRASLFPDLDGLSRHLSWCFKWNWRL